MVWGRAGEAGTLRWTIAQQWGREGETGTGLQLWVWVKGLWFRGWCGVLQDARQWVVGRTGPQKAFGL